MHRSPTCHTPVSAVSIAVVVFAAVVWASPSSAAQTPNPPAAPPQAAAGGTAATNRTDPNPGALTLTGSFDVLNQYMFHGIRQNSTGLAMWPAVDLGVAAYSGHGGLKSVGINLGTWNSMRAAWRLLPPALRR